MQLQRLFKRTKTDAIQVCNISTLGNTFIVEFGQLDGKLQNRYTPCEGKNIGKSNETSPEEQAILEAKAKWTKKVKAGYSTSVAAPVTVQLPQLVKKYLDHVDAVVFPAYSGVKLNGINGTYWLMPDDTLKLTSRGGDEYPRIPHLEQDVRNNMAKAKTTCMNGELYIHGEHLQDINSAVKKTKALSAKLRFRVFELPLIDKPYKDKVATLRSLYDAADITKVDSVEELETCYLRALSKKYEGTVIFNAHAEYKFNERSSNVFKYKPTLDAEFMIVDFELDKNSHAVYVCNTPNGEQFKVKRKGTNEERLVDTSLAYFNIGRWLNVEYEMLSKAGKPLKPVGLDFRVCNTNGEPLE